MRPLSAVVPIVLVSSLLAAGAHTAQAVPAGDLPSSFCSLAPDGTVNTFTGAFGDAWENDDNWSDPAGYPGLGGGDPDACVPAGKTVVIGAGQEEHVRTLDVATGAVVTVDEGGKLFLYGKQSLDQDSAVRSGGRIDVIGGTLGGVAKLHVRGTVVLKNNGPGAAATVLTRDCSYDPSSGPSYDGEETCTSPTPTPVVGQTFFVEVDDAGVVDVQGGGVNLGDQTRVLVRGLLRVRSGAYVAADHGTEVELRAHRTTAAGTGTLRFEGNGGFLEGKIEADTGIARLSTLTNEGLVTKTAGTGRTLVSAAYTQTRTGAVSVRTGTLLLPTGQVTPASVAGGATYGTGRCEEPDDPTCTPTTKNENGFRQSADLRVPSADTSGARVVVRQLSTKSSSADLGFPFEVHATSLAATATAPAVIRLRLDASVTGGKGWSTTKVFRKSGTNPYRVVKACLSTGKPPSGEVACVDRRGLAGSSRNIANDFGAPDVLMVIRTTRTSRWVGR